MFISYNWLQDFVDFRVLDKKALEKVVVGQIKKLEKHPNADGLKVVQVDIGGEPTQIVCAGLNLKKNAYVAVALPGAILSNGMVIKKNNIREIKSHGMLCAAEEIGIGKEGNVREILILDAKKKYTPGKLLLDELDLDAYGPKELSDMITKHTAEVEDVVPLDKWLHNIVSGKLLDYESIKGSEKLSKATFDVGWKKIQVIFGKVHKVKVGEILPVALVGAKLPGGEIQKKEILGVMTEGMICTDEEMGLENTLEGLTRFPSGTPLGKPVADLLGMRGYKVDIDNKSLTHRPDLWGHYGFARELSTILKTPLKPLDPLLKYKHDSEEAELKIDIQCDDICPRMVGAIVTGIKIEESPQWLKTKLQSVGLNPLNNVVDITNYVMWEIGEPMHAFDRKVLGADKIIVRNAKKDEVLVTLDEKELKLHPEDLILCDSKNTPVGLGGIKGGLKSGISSETTELILEAENVDAITIRKSSTRHGIRTDASQRFEKGLDPTLPEIVIKRAIVLLKEVCPSAKVISKIADEGTWKAKKIKIKVSPKDINRKIGVIIPTKEMVRILEALEFKVTNEVVDLVVEVPSHRACGDVSIAEDIVEEIARIHGYDQVPAELPDLPIKLPIENSERLHKHAARRIMAYSLGFTEVLNYSFYSKDRFQKAGLEEEGHIKVLNYLSEDQTHMRVSMVPNLLASILQNSHEHAEMRIFEIGHTYREIGEYMPLEEKRIAAACIGKGEMFYDAKGALLAFLEEFRAGKVTLKESESPPPYAHPKKCMDVIVRGKMLGHLFTLHPGTSKAFDIEQDLAIFDLQFNWLVEHGRNLQEFRSLAKFPAMNFDISVLVDKKAKAKDVERAITRADKDKLVKSIRIFDIYEGKSLPDDQKSISFKIEIRHDERTLTDAEFQKIQSAIFLALEKIGGKIRGKQTQLD